MRPFHLAFPVDNLEKTREFYTKVLDCKEGRSSDKWIDFDMYGHQVVAHLVDELQIVQTNSVDGDKVPSSHFGVILEMKEWRALSTCLKNSEISFIIDPAIADPPISFFIFLIELPGLIFTPPVSKVTPLPIMTKG